MSRTTRVSPTTGALRPKLGRSRANVGVGIAALIVVLGLVLVGLQLHSSQSSSRDRVAARFVDRASVVSALTQAVFESAAAPSDATRAYGAAKVSGRSLDQAVTQGHLGYAVLLNQRGQIVAASRTLPESARARIRASAGFKAMLAGAPVLLSDVQPGGPGGAGTIELAVGIKSVSGPRVFVTALPTPLLSAFLGGYLRRIPTRDGTAYVVDSRGAIIASRDTRAVVGRRIAQPGLLRAAEHRSAGSFGRDGYFAAVAVPGSTWRVVLDLVEVDPLQRGVGLAEVAPVGALHRARYRRAGISRGAAAAAGQRRSVVNGQPAARGQQRSPGELECAAAPRVGAGAVQRGAGAVRVDRFARSPGAVAQDPDVRGSPQGPRGGSPVGGGAGLPWPDERRRRDGCAR